MQITNWSIEAAARAAVAATANQKPNASNLTSGSGGGGGGGRLLSFRWLSGLPAKNLIL